MPDEELLDRIDKILDNIEEFWAIAVTDELVDAVILAFTMGLVDSATYIAELKGISVGVSFNVVDPEVIEFLKEFAAEMVRNINKGTRFYLRSMIYTGFREGVGEDDLVKTILEGLFDVSDFSENRVKSICRFEIAKAQTKGWIKQLNEVGVKTKTWITVGPDACETCKENEAMGPQPVNSKNFLTVFGNEKTDGPPAHPNVERCHLGIPADELDKMGMTVEWYTGKSEVTEMGGPKSGHYGHKGRPGKRGGSAPSKDGARAKLSEEVLSRARGRYGRSMSPIRDWRGHFTDRGYSSDEIDRVELLLKRHGSTGASQEADREIVKELRSDTRIGQLLRDQVALETRLYEEWEKGAKERGESLWLYRKGEHGRDLEAWTYDPEGARMGTFEVGGIGWDQQMSYLELKNEGYSILGGMAQYLGAPGEREITLVKIGKSEVVEMGGPKSGHYGHRGGRGGKGHPGGSRPSKAGAKASLALSGVMSKKNLAALELNQGSLVEATEKGRIVDKALYHPQTDQIMAGATQHAIIKIRYAPKEAKYDDFVKIQIFYRPDGPPQLDINVNRHTARSVADAWNKAFDAAKAMKKAGFPGDTDVWLTAKGSVAEIKLEEL